MKQNLDPSGLRSYLSCPLLFTKFNHKESLIKPELADCFHHLFFHEMNSEKLPDFRFLALGWGRFLKAAFPEASFRKRNSYLIRMNEILNWYRENIFCFYKTVSVKLPLVFRGDRGGFYEHEIPAVLSDGRTVVPVVFIDNKTFPERNTEARIACAILEDVVGSEIPQYLSVRFSGGGHHIATSELIKVSASQKRTALTGLTQILETIRTETHLPNVSLCLDCKYMTQCKP